MRSLSITHVDSEASWRGGQQSLLTLARGLRELGHSQTIVCPAASALAARAIEDGFTVAAKVPRTGDIVHAHSGRAHNQVLRATLGAAVTRVVTRHVAFAPKHPLVHRLKYTKTCDGIIAVSGAVRETLTKAGIPASHIEVIHTGIVLPPAVMRPPREGPFTVGHIGAFTKEKGQEVAIAGARLLPEVSFRLAGEGPQRADLERDAPSNVSFEGFLADLATFFGEIDVFLMPSHSEAWGLAALEAMAHGVPVIASDIQGLAEIVQGGSGWLVPEGDAQALAQAIREASQDPMLLAVMGRAGRARAAEFTVEDMARKTEAFYRQLLRDANR